MRTSSIFAGLSAASLVLAAPLAERADPTDVQILQYALTLEHLENAFYSGALAKFSAADFQAAGYPDWVRARVAQIASHEASHTKLLSAAIGDSATKPCVYAFPYTDIPSFIGLAYGIENIGVAAYAGANQYIKDPLYSTVAATILSVEARHNGFLGGPVLKYADWTGPYDTPLNLNQVYTLAAQLIVSCPAGNPALPVRSYGALTSGGSPIFNAIGGTQVTLAYKGMGAGQYAAIYNGLGATVVPISADGKFTLPLGVQGFSFVLISTASDAGTVNDSNTIAGPAEINSPYDAFTSSNGFMNPYGA